MRFHKLAEALKSMSPDVLFLNRQELGVPKIVPPRREELPEAPSPLRDVMAVIDKRKILEDRFLARWQELGGCNLQREYRFDAERRWRFDFAIPILLIAFEIQGGLYAPQTGHRSLAGVQRDYEKFNAAQLAGWRVFQVSSKAMGDSEFMAKLVKFVRTEDIVG